MKFFDDGELRNEKSLKSVEKIWKIQLFVVSL